MIQHLIMSNHLKNRNKTCNSRLLVIISDNHLHLAVCPDYHTRQQRTGWLRQECTRLAGLVTGCGRGGQSLAVALKYNLQRVSNCKYTLNPSSRPLIVCLEPFKQTTNNCELDNWFGESQQMILNHFKLTSALSIFKTKIMNDSLNL